MNYYKWSNGSIHHHELIMDPQHEMMVHALLGETRVALQIPIHDEHVSYTLPFIVSTMHQRLVSSKHVWVKLIIPHVGITIPHK